MNDAMCDIKECGNAAWTNGFCQLHYWRIRRHGTARDSRETPEQRFWKNVHKTSDCWIWIGSRNTAGYGNFKFNGKLRLAHRLSYEWSTGETIPIGLYLDHLCHVRHCVNPLHLEPVTPRTNAIRCDSPAAENSRKTHCKRGHEFTAENTYVQPGRQNRHCRACRRETMSEKRAEKPKRRANANTDKTVCKYGHPLEGDNLMVLAKQRRCRTCHNRLSAEGIARARERRNAQSTVPAGN